MFRSVLPVDQQTFRKSLDYQKRAALRYGVFSLGKFISSGIVMDVEVSGRLIIIDSLILTANRRFLLAVFYSPVTSLYDSLDFP